MIFGLSPLRTKKTCSEEALWFSMCAGAAGAAVAAAGGDIQGKDLPEIRFRLRVLLHCSCAASR